MRKGIDMLKVGDRIVCHDTEDLIDTMNNLARAGVQTDFWYQDGGNVLVVTKIE